MIGKIRYAPGTIASLATCLLFLFLINFLNIFTIFFITLIIFFYSFVALNNSFDTFKSDDPQEIVIDEVIGYWISVLIFWIGIEAYSVPSLIVLFVLFRFFDIVKFGPVKKMEEIEGGHGILLDDVVAGVFAGVVALIIYSTGLI